MSFAGKACVVTGAASGIGRALALGLAGRGARLALSDVDADGLAQTAQDAAAKGVEVDHRPLDVADRAAWEAYAPAVAERFGVVHQLYNNAGIAHSRSVLDSTIEEYERVLGINLWGVIYGTKAFLPHVIASGDGAIVNVSSVNGFMAQPSASHYVTSKFAVRGFTETLRLEMEQAGHRVLVSSVHPGGIRTNIATNAMKSARAQGLPVTEADERRERTYNQKLLKMPPEQAAEIILKGVDARKTRILVGNDARAIDAAVRALPTRYAKGVLAFEKKIS